MPLPAEQSTVPMGEALPSSAVDAQDEDHTVTFENSTQCDKAWARKVQQTLLKATWLGTQALKVVVPKATAVALLDAVEHILKHEKTLVEIDPHDGDRVTVVGDTHGQFHDVCNMLSLAGHPAEDHYVIFNGDYVDRGAWGFELLLLLAALKLSEPKHTVLLRGNHESTTCTTVYGFRSEVLAKYGPKDGKVVYQACKRMFCQLPLAALVKKRTLVVHGGLFRKPSKSHKKRKRLFITQPMTSEHLGSLEDLRASSKGGMDPNGCGASVLATDVLWSDPVLESGVRENEARGVGLVFGPDVTADFLRDNNLSLILRSHEGPDARQAAIDEALAEAAGSPPHEGIVEGQNEGIVLGGNAQMPWLVAEASAVPDLRAPSSPDTASIQPVVQEPPEAASTAPAVAATTADVSPSTLLAVSSSPEDPLASCMSAMQDGYAEDHVTPHGKLYTVFSAPCYPQFIPEEDTPCNNRGAVAVLRAPTFTEPTFLTYEAMLPRPAAQPYYDIGEVAGSDEEYEQVLESSMDLSKHGTTLGSPDTEEQLSALSAEVISQPLPAAAPLAPGMIPVPVALHTVQPAVIHAAQPPAAVILSPTTRRAAAAAAAAQAHANLAAANTATANTATVPVNSAATVILSPTTRRATKAAAATQAGQTHIPVANGTACNGVAKGPAPLAQAANGVNHAVVLPVSVGVSGVAVNGVVPEALGAPGGPASADCGSKAGCTVWGCGSAGCGAPRGAL